MDYDAIVNVIVHMPNVSSCWIRYELRLICLFDFIAIQGVFRFLRKASQPVSMLLNGMFPEPVCQAVETFVR